MVRQDKYYFKKENSAFKDYAEEVINKLIQAYQSKRPLRKLIQEMDLQGVTP